MTQSEREMTREMVSALHKSSGSFELVFGAVIAALTGLLIDRVVGTTPIFTVTFAIAGLIGAITSIVFGYRLKMQAAAGARDSRRQASEL